MTDHQIPTPLPSHATILDDAGMPTAVVNIDDIQANAIKLAYDMAAACGDAAALDDVSAFWMDEVGPDAFGYVAAGALRTLAQYILDPTLMAVEALAPEVGKRLRDKLVEGAENAEASL